jgi:hypothetical protein
MLSLSVLNLLSSIGGFESWGGAIPALFMSWGGAIAG